jgi:hypothetical protein
MKTKITRKELEKLKKEYDYEKAEYHTGEKVFKSESDFLAWYDRNHGLGYGIEVK